MADLKYDLVEAQLVFGREAARHGDWSIERHAAAAELLRELATLGDANLKSVGVHVEIGAHPTDPHRLRFDFTGQRVVIAYEAGVFNALDPAGKRPALEIDLDFNAYTGLFETHESDPAHPGARRSAATSIMKKLLQQLHST